MTYKATNYAMGVAKSTITFDAANRQEAVVTATRRLGGMKNAIGQNKQPVAVIGVQSL